MRRLTLWSGGLLAAVLGIALAATPVSPGAPPPAPPAPPDPGPVRGAKRLDPPALAEPYRKRWAVVVGINYEGAADPTRPVRLKNAANDATAVFALLCHGYGYEENRTAFKLIEGGATEARIRARLRETLCDPAVVAPNDSVLVFFAGHGKRRKAVNRPTKEEGVILAADAVLRGDDQQPASGFVPMTELVGLLRDECPARHKLLVLDCCYSGEMFRGEVQAVEVRESAWTQGVFREPAFQGLAAARNKETALDADKGQPNHSPFTYGLTEALRRLPRSLGPGMPVPASKVFSFLKWTVNRNPFGDDHQQPGLRWLTADQGEFHFLPSPKLFAPELLTDEQRRLFDPERLTDEDVVSGTLLLPGSYGAWWFAEVPWFIPSLRGDIVKAALAARDQTPAVRGTRKDGLHKYFLQAAAARVRDLKGEWANRACKLDRDGKPDPACRLAQLRLECLERLQDETVRKEPRRVYEDLRAKLTALRDAGAPFEGSDLHLIAVLAHRLGRPDALDDYRAARRQYDAQIAAYKDHPARSFVPAPDEGLKLLCLTDTAEFLAARRAYTEAARTFDQALLEGVPVPTPFRVYALARAADCWQLAGHARAADDRLAAAFAAASGPRLFPGDKAPSPAVTDELQSYVHYRRAWTHVDQFDYASAAHHFATSNRLLDELARAAGDARGPDRSGIWGARVMRLHNEHGLAITERYAGHFDRAAERYQLLIREVRTQFAVLRDEGGGAEEVLDVREQLAERLVNALERRGECFLFRPDPDAKEAQAELAQAVRVCPYLTAASRDARRAEVQLKLALAYALPSPFQDLDLAARTHREAGALLGRAPVGPRPKADAPDDDAPAPDPVRVLWAVPDALVRYYQSEPAADRLTALRKALYDLRPDANRNLSRDELDALLAGCGVLLREGAAAGDRYAQLGDAEFALSLARIAIRAGGRDMQRYFRHHYDAALRAVLAARPRHVKGLLEAAWEATTGRTWDKPPRPVPVLAAYVLDDRLLFFLDVPGGVSKVYDGGAAFALPRVARATKNGQRAALPAELTDELIRLADTGLGGAHTIRARGEPVPAAVACVGGGMATVAAASGYRTDRLNLHWFDPLHGIGTESGGGAGATTAGYRPGALAEFPFALPDWNQPD